MWELKREGRKEVAEVWWCGCLHGLNPGSQSEEFPLSPWGAVVVKSQGQSARSMQLILSLLLLGLVVLPPPEVESPDGVDDQTYSLHILHLHRCQVSGGRGEVGRDDVETKAWEEGRGWRRWRGRLRIRQGDSGELREDR